MLANRVRAAMPQTDLEAELDATLVAVLRVMPLQTVLAALARVAETKRMEARGGRKIMTEHAYDLVQGRLELAIEDLQTISGGG